MVKKYDAVIIGFGKGGKTLAAALGVAGKKTVLLEKSPKMYGGTCINVGCIPTKFLVRKSQESKLLGDFESKAKLYKEAIEGELALTTKLRAKNLEKVESVPNVEVITGIAKIISENQVEVKTVDGVEIFEAEQIFLNTGSVPVIPAIEGLGGFDGLGGFVSLKGLESFEGLDGLEGKPKVVTSEGLLMQKELPEHLVIIGGGYIGVEFSSVYADFGSKVTVIQNGPRFLPREDEDIASAVRESLSKRGVEILTETQTKAIVTKGDKAVVTVVKGNETIELEADTVLVATGRRPNTEGLGLENAGVELTPRGGLVVNEKLQTTNPNIYAMGDVIGGMQFTYISLDDYRIVRSAVLGDGSYTSDKRGAVPYSAFLNPPFSRVGLSEEEAKAKGYSVKIAKLPAAAIPKAMVLGQTDGLLKAVIDAETNQILGAHLFCAESHEIINTVKLAMDAGLPYTVLRDMIFTHPTMSEALNDLFNV